MVEMKFKEKDDAMHLDIMANMIHIQEIMLCPRPLSRSPSIFSVLIVIQINIII